MIEISGLGKRFDGVQAVRDLDLLVGDGEIFGLLGPNGAGKTTTVRMLAGLIEPTTGTAVINGHRLGHETTRIRGMTGILTESPGLHDRLTGRENLGYYGRLYGLRGTALRRAVDRYLDVVGLRDEADRKVATYSKGMRQKIAIARALLHDPEVIYLDEPTSGLDPSAAKQVRDFVATLRDAGRSIIVCTHNLDEAERLSDRIGILRGSLLKVGTPRAMRRHGRQVTTQVELVGPARRFVELMGPLEGVRSARAHENRLVIEVTDPRRDNPLIVDTLVAAGARILTVTEEAASLEDVYLALVGEAGERDRPATEEAPEAVAAAWRAG